MNMHLITKAPFYAYSKALPEFRLPLPLRLMVGDFRLFSVFTLAVTLAIFLPFEISCYELLVSSAIAVDVF